MDTSLEVLLFLFAVALTAGFIDTLAGGGGLITIPSLLLCGVPPLLSLGTNKMQGVVGTATATFFLIRSRSLRWREIRSLCLIAFAGAATGTLAVQFVDTESLRWAIPIVLSVIAVYFMFLPVLSAHARKIRLSDGTYAGMIIPGIGFYDGLVGPGTGSFFAFAGMAFRGQDMISSTVSAKAFNFATNLASVSVFVFSGQIVWVLAVAMMLGQSIGAHFGARILVTINRQLLRAIIVMMCLAMLAKYGYSHW